MHSPWHSLHYVALGVTENIYLPASHWCQAPSVCKWKPLHRGACLLFSFVWNVWGRKAEQYLNHDKLEEDNHLKIAATQPRTIIAPKSDRFCFLMGRTYRPVSICRCFSGRLIRAGSFYFIFLSVPDVLIFSVMWECPWWGLDWDPYTCVIKL